MARKLKGKSAENLKGDKKLKKEATLKRMDDNKIKDTVRLRTAITERLEVLKAEYDKVEEAVQQNKAKIAELENTKLSMQGAYRVLTELLQ